MRSTLLLAFVLCSTVTISQEAPPFCATDEMHQQLFNEHPEYNAGIVSAHEKLQSFTEQYIQQNHSRGGTPYIIPVVFHIIHNNGEENINDSQILDAVKQVNIQFRKMNADTSEIVASFKSIAADAGVELRLAQLDPDGNCTSGITRTVSSLTNIGDHQVKSLIQWPPDQYLNVYVCNQAAGLAGHALLPAAADTVPEWDGIVMQHSYIGTFGTSEYFRRTVLSHEIGHYLNLQHIWGGNNVPDYYYLPVAQAGNCAFDDDVADTPLTIGWQSCSLSGSSCSTLDNVQNYMDYAYCARMFTEGQKQRMHACLNSSVANRDNLWTPTNLAATGTDDATYYLCRAKFEADKRIACAGETVTFTDVSLHGVDSRVWTVNGGTPSSTTDSVITVLYSTPGSYDVTLSVQSGMQQKDTTLADFIRILPNPGTISEMHEPFENQANFEARWIVLPNGNSSNWDLTADAGFMSNQSIFVDNFNATASGFHEFFSEPIDASSHDALVVSFDYAYANNQVSTGELLQVLTSNDCGENWTVRKTYLALASLATVDTLVTSAFYPADETQWKSDVITNIPLASLTDNLMVKFKFTAVNGNNLFIDNIRIIHPDQLGNTELLLDQLAVYPNPMNEMFTLKIPTGVDVQKIELTDMNGKTIPVQTEISNGEVNVACQNINAGLYIVHVYSPQGVKRLKIVKE